MSCQMRKQPPPLSLLNILYLQGKKKISQNFQRQSQTEYLYNQFIWDMTLRKKTLFLSDIDQFQ